MWWSARKNGRRKADERLRERYPDAANSVLWINSLRGAALVGGALLAFRVRQAFPGTGITESHPKALLKVPAFTEKFGTFVHRKNEHERDALVAALCAREGFRERWTTDLAEQRYDAEQDPKSYWLAPMCYFWPERI